MGRSLEKLLLGPQHTLTSCNGCHKLLLIILWAFNPSPHGLFCKLIHMGRACHKPFLDQYLTKYQYRTHKSSILTYVEVLLQIWTFRPHLLTKICVVVVYLVDADQTFFWRKVPHSNHRWCHFKALKNTLDNF